MSLIEAKNKAILTSQKYNPSGIVPFPFNTIADDIDELSIFYLKNMPDGVSGAIYYQDDAFVIVINQNKPWVRQNFTVAHELGHYFLHHDWLKENAQSGLIDYSEIVDGAGMLLRPDEQPTDKDALIKEREANNFAAELLMPESKVRQYWDLSHDVDDTAEAFQVSVAAMAIRLERLGLV